MGSFTIFLESIDEYRLMLIELFLTHRFDLLERTLSVVDESLSRLDHGLRVAYDCVSKCLVSLGDDVSEGTENEVVNIIGHLLLAFFE